MTIREKILQLIKENKTIEEIRKEVSVSPSYLKQIINEFRRYNLIPPSSYSLSYNAYRTVTHRYVREDGTEVLPDCLRGYFSSPKSRRARKYHYEWYDEVGMRYYVRRTTLPKLPRI